MQESKISVNIIQVRLRVNRRYVKWCNLWGTRKVTLCYTGANHYLVCDLMPTVMGFVASKSDTAHLKRGLLACFAQHST